MTLTSDVLGVPFLRVWRTPTPAPTTRQPTFFPQRTALVLAGFGRDNLRFIDTDENYAMRPNALADAIKLDNERGLTPCAVVGTTGTTTTTALDPIDAIAKIARQHNVWLHVDAAMAGSAMILPECRWMWEGREEERERERWGRKEK